MSRLLDGETWLQGLDLVEWQMAFRERESRGKNSNYNRDRVMYILGRLNLLITWVLVGISKGFGGGY